MNNDKIREIPHYVARNVMQSCVLCQYADSENNACPTCLNEISRLNRMTNEQYVEENKRNFEKFKNSLTSNGIYEFVSGHQLTTWTQPVTGETYQFENKMDDIQKVFQRLRTSIKWPIKVIIQSKTDNRKFTITLDGAYRKYFTYDFDYQTQSK